MKLKKEDLQVGLDFWLWAVENPGEDKGDWERYGELDEYRNACPFCEAHQDCIKLGPVECCATCPLVKKEMACRADQSPYEIWTFRGPSRKEKSQAAQQIADVFREEIEKLGEEK